MAYHGVYSPQVNDPGLAVTSHTTLAEIFGVTQSASVTDLRWADSRSMTIEKNKILELRPPDSMISPLQNRPSHPWSINNRVLRAL